MSSSKKLPPKLVPWAEARWRHRLSHAHVQMARELGMNPKKLGKLDNCDQEPWKAPLPEFIAQIYFKRFGRERPAEVFSLEGIAARQQAKKTARRADRVANAAERAPAADPVADSSPAEDDRGERPSLAEPPDGPPWF